MAKHTDPEGTQLAGVRSLVSFHHERVLEIGCGDGRLTFGYASDAASVDASDPDADAITKATQALPEALSERVTFTVAAAGELKVPRSSIDLVFFSWSL
jgi:ubiquinone/menaquinone biosynthesis C-methylase UbiE